MDRVPQRSVVGLETEKVAYWYLRLNGFLQIENFIVHPERRGGQRTDADLLAVRFPFRAERLFDDPNDVMRDDVEHLGLSPDLIDVAIVEIKSNQPCTLNGPWTRADQRNVHRVLAAIGCFPPNKIGAAAEDIYRTGCHISSVPIRVRLIAIGRDRNDELAAQYPHLIQLLWPDMLAFIWQRLHQYRQQKTQVDQWDTEGLKIKALADDASNARDFIQTALRRMGVGTISSNRNDVG